MLQKSTLHTNTDAPKASKEHKQFHKLLEKIELLKKMIEEKKQLASKFNQQKNEHVLPLVIQLCAVKLSQIRALDWAYDRTKFSKRIRARLAEEILTRINELFHSFQVDETQEKELMVIFARHTGADVDELKEEKFENEQEAARDFLWEHYGIEMDENESVDLNDPEVVEKIKAKIAEEAAYQKDNNRQSKSTKGKDSKAEQLHDKLSKSIRSVYTSLVKLLHPDREMDESKKTEKTEAIKEVTLAYENKDMLTLLILQAKYGLVEDSLDDSDLKGYNAVLRKQAAELENQHLEIINASYGIPINNEKSLDKFLKSEKTHLKKSIKYEQSILQDIFENEELLADYLKQDYY